MTSVIFVIIGYLLGSLSSAIILSKLMKFPDPRTQGSGNAGATNVLRTLGRDKAIMVLVGDVVKGFIAVILARVFGVQGFMLAMVALAAVAGHIFPLYFKFKGGKGVATAMGSIIALSLWIGIITVIAWLVVAFLFRYSSLASLVSVILAPVLLLILGTASYALPVFIITALIFWKHQENIQRLRDKTEPKIQFK